MITPDQIRNSAKFGSPRCEMTKDEIIKMAVDAGSKQINDYYTNGTVKSFTPATLERFANLVAAQEREACALICETLELPEWPDKVRQPLADAIRARSQS